MRVRGFEWGTGDSARLFRVAESRAAMLRIPRIPKLAGLEANVLKLGAVRFLCWMHLMSAVIMPFFREWGRLSFAQIFALQTWFMVMSFLMEVPTGAVADRFGRKVSVAGGGFLLAAASVLYGTFPSLAVFVVAEALFAVAIALISGADEALAYDSLLAQGRESEASRVMARLEAAKLTGILAGALLGAVVASRLGVRWPMLLQAVPLGLSGLAALTLTEPPRAKEDASERSGYLRLLSGGLHHFRSAPELRALAVDQVACATVAWLVIWLYQLQLERVGVPLAAFGVVHAAMGLGQIAFLSRLATVERLVGGRARVARLDRARARARDARARRRDRRAGERRPDRGRGHRRSRAAADLQRARQPADPLGAQGDRALGGLGGADARGRHGLPGGGGDPRPLAGRGARLRGRPRPGRRGLRPRARRPLRGARRSGAGQF